MAKEFIEVEGKKLEVYHKNLGVSDYVVYNNKIYKQVGYIGAGKEHKKELFKESTNERIWVSGNDLAKIKYITSHRGYMKI